MGVLFDRLTIKQKIMALVSLIFVLTTLILSVVFDRVIVHHAMADTEEAASLISLQADRTVMAYTQLLKEDLVMLSREGEIRQGGYLTVYLHNPNAVNGRVEMDPEYMQGYELRVFNTLQRFVNAHGVKAAQVSLATSDGGFVEYPATNQANTFDPRKESWYQGAWSSPGKVTVSSPFHSARATPAIKAAITVQGWDGQPQGVMALDMDLSALSELTEYLKPGDLGAMMLLDDNNVILLDPLHTGTAFKKLEEVGLGDLSAMGPRSSGMRRVILDDAAKYANVYTSKTTGLKYITIIDEGRLMASVNQLRLILVLVFLAALGGGLAGAWWLTGRIIAPLKVLEEKAGSIAVGDLKTAEEVMESDDEIGRLSYAFQEMGATLRQELQDLQNGAGEVATATGKLATNLTAYGEAAGDAITAADKVIAWQAAQAERLRKTADELAGLLATTETTAENSPPTKDTLTATRGELKKLRQETGADLKNGQESLQKLKEALKKVRELCETAGMPATNLRDSFRKISEVMARVTEIAEQTNLLALNAAVESVRYSGKAKSKFTAVAEEIRKLSAQAGDAAKNGEKILAAITEEVATLTTAWQEGQGQAIEGRKEAQRAEELLRQVTRRRLDEQEILNKAWEDAATPPKSAVEERKAAKQTLEEAAKFLRETEEAGSSSLQEAQQGLKTQQEHLVGLKAEAGNLAELATKMQSEAGKFKI
ncbi:MAG: methyl-accepting chemotaxis protein [Selenomonadaceae bacterium]|nr:methyl-accepting chemotaxis protein [Selenomonadaceae bacterium]